MSRLKLVADPKFRAKVAIPLAGGDPVEVEFQFKHKTKTALNEFISSREGKSDTDTIFEITAGWELEDEFNKENVNTLLENYAGSAVAIYQTYIEELVQARVKN